MLIPAIDLQSIDSKDFDNEYIVNDKVENRTKIEINEWLDW